MCGEGRKFKISITAFWVILLVTFAFVTTSTAKTLLGPTKVSVVLSTQNQKTKGKPNQSLESFHAKQGIATLNIMNGDENGQYRTSSAIVSVNGNALLTPSSFNQKFGSTELEIYVEETNTLSVEVRGKPGSYITVIIEQELPCLDADQDGFPFESGCGYPVDCNDNNANVSPGASEIFDGIDNQCPGDQGYGETDEGFISYSPIGNDGLVAYWPLDYGWEDIWGNNHLTPSENGGFSESPIGQGNAKACYGPTGQTENNGAFNDELSQTLKTIVSDTGRGITLEGWVYFPDNSFGGQFFGFGGGAYGEIKFNVAAFSGSIKVLMGHGANGVIVSYPRLAPKCWHHVAFVLPPDYESGGSFNLYVDGEWVEPSKIHRYSSSGAYAQGATLFGTSFRMGTFASSSAGKAKVDEVRLWARAISEDEAGVLAEAIDPSEKCILTNIPDWSPGKRCSPPEQLPAPQLEHGVRVLSDNMIAVVSDPNPWLKSQLAGDCGDFLTELEKNKEAVPEWSYILHYKYAVKETLMTYRPTVLKALSQPASFKILDSDGSEYEPLSANLWSQATRQFRVNKMGGTDGDVVTSSSENVYFSYLSLPFNLEPGKSYTIQGPYGQPVIFSYDPDVTVSWALKVNQVGYLPNAPEKYAYLGAWLGPAGGAMDLGRFNDAPFEICSENDGEVVYTGRIAYRGSDGDRLMTGENLYQLDFSDFATPGRYYVRVQGVGRSWPFEIGQNALGEAFYIHSRGLYHQRCGTELTEEFTAWPRGDNHTITYKGGFPPDLEDYGDHTADGWGFFDEEGTFPHYNKWFDVVAYTATDEVVPGVNGGWHDAADFDRRPYHFGVVNDLAHAYIFFPENYTDGQLNLPESGNGIPDILDEAIWGMDVWRRAQEPDGRVGTWIEATSHPAIPNPSIDTQRYYLSLATRNSSLQYAEHAALLGRALVTAGSVKMGNQYIESAKRAYAFGTNPDVRVETTFKVDDTMHRWIEPPEPDTKRRVRALIQLWLATGQDYDAELLAMGQIVLKEVTDLHWRTRSFNILDIALAEKQLPPEWVAAARKRIIDIGNDWLAWQKTHLYRKLWYSTDHGYFSHMSWGNSGFRNIQRLICGWRLTGEEKYRTGALLAVDWLHGANPQGRVNTTGLGYNRVVNPLHLPSSSDQILEPVPGISIYGYTGSVHWIASAQVYGLFDDPRPDHDFAGSSMALLPPPWDDPLLSKDYIHSWLYEQIPVWRRLVSLENINVVQSEFTVYETISPAAVVTGCLMGSGWKPSAELLNRPPLSEELFIESLWHHP